MSTATTNFGLIKPDVGSVPEQDLWGGYTNTDWDSVDVLMKTAINMVKSSKTANFSVTASTSGSTTTGDNKKLFLCDATSASFAGTLPTAASAGDGFVIGFKKADVSANTLTVTPNGSEKIDGAATFVLSAQYAYVVLQCDGTTWNIISQTSSTAGLAPLASPTFTGVPKAPTASPSDNSTQLATTAYADAAAIAAGSGKAPIPTSSAGVGQVISVVQASSYTYTLPAGGVWLYSLYAMDPATGAIYSGNGRTNAGLASGGTALTIGGGSATSISGFVWRIN